MEDNIKDFTLRRQEVWVALLDGNPVQGKNKMACDNKGDISRSFTHKLRDYNIHQQYGFKSAVEMKNYLVSTGRLEFKNII